MCNSQTCCSEPQTCCPKFNPEGWDDKEISWDQKKFIKDRVRSFFHIPLNFGAVMQRNMAKIQASQAHDKPMEMLVLSDENSLWGADVYLEVNKDVPGACMTTISGTFIAKVFEGPYKDVPKWMATMQEHIKAKGKELKKIYTYYTTCPKCAKLYGKNYVVLLAQV